MTNHPHPPTAARQCAAILRRLQQANGDSVSVLDLIEASGACSHTRRIHELRKAGYKIEQFDKYPRGIRASFYRLSK